MKLVIAEKPSVAQSLAAVIGATIRKDGYLEGGGWRVSWCVGYLAGLADADAYNPDYAKWRYDDLPILPEPWQMVVSKDKKKQFDILKQLMNAPDVAEVVNACDAGREGELIFRSVYELAGCQKPMKRLWISSMEDSDLPCTWAAGERRHSPLCDRRRIPVRQCAAQAASGTAGRTAGPFLCSQCGGPYRCPAQRPGCVGD